MMLVTKFFMLVHFASKILSHAISAPNDAEIVKGTHFSQLDDSEKEFISNLIRSGLQESKQNCISRYDLQENPEDGEVLRREVAKLKDLIGVVKEQQYVLKLLQNQVRTYPKTDSGEELKNLQRELLDLKQQMQGFNPAANDGFSPHNSKISEKLDKQQNDIEVMKQMLHSLMGNLAEKKQEKPSMQEMFYELSKIEKKLAAHPHHAQNASWESNDLVGGANPLYLPSVMRLPMPAQRNGADDGRGSIRHESTFARSTSEDLQTILSALVASNEEKTEDSGMEKLMKELNKKAERQKLEKQLKVLEKHLGHVESKSDVNTDGENLSKLLVKLLSAKSKPESKELDNSVLDELKQLEKSIKAISNSKNMDEEQGNLLLDDFEEKARPNINNLSNADLLKLLMRRKQKQGHPEQPTSMNNGYESPSIPYPMYDYPETQYGVPYNRPLYGPQPIPMYESANKYGFHEQQFFPMPQDTARPSYQTQYSSGPYGAGPPTYTQDNYQEIDDLKQQIYELQRDISNYNNEDDKAIVYNLDKQMGELQNIIKSLQAPTVPRPIPAPAYMRPPQRPPQPPPQPSYRPILPVMKPVYQVPVQIPQSNGHQHGPNAPIPERPVAPPSKPEPYQRYKRSLDVQLHPVNNYILEDFNRRINDINKQLEIHMPGAYSRATDSYNYNSPSDYTDSSVAKLKKDDIFDKLFDRLLTKILDKVSRAFPRVLQALFGKFEVSFDGYSKEGGLFGVLPLIVMNILQKIKTIVDYLQRNKFFRNFLIPFGTLGVVAGAVVFLIWWFQLQDDAQQIDYVYDNYMNVPQSYQ